MSSDLQEDFDFSFKQQPTSDTDPFTAISDAHYLFGQYDQNIGDFPHIESKITPNFFAGNRDAQSLSIASIRGQGDIVFLPVNSLWWYYFLGQSSTTTGVHTITGIDTGELPIFTTRARSKGSSASTTDHLLDCKVNQLGFNVDFQRARFAGQTLGFDLFRMKDPGYDDTNQVAAIYPDSVDDLYRNDYTGTEFIWDAAVGGDQVNYTSDMLRLTYQGIVSSELIDIASQLYPAFNLDGNRFHVISWDQYRRSDTSIRDDKLDQDTNEVFRDMTFKIYQTATKYKKINFNNVGITSLKMNHAFDLAENKPTYRINAICTDISVESNDGLTPSTFYGE